MKYMNMILLFVATLALIAGAVYYLSSRFALFFPALSPKVWLWVFSALLVTALTGMIAFPTTIHPVGKFIFMTGGVICSILICLLLAIIVTDLLYLIFKISPRIRCFISVGLASLLTIYGIWSAYTIAIKEVTIPIRGLTKEVRALHLTDVHLGNFRGEKQVKRMARKIKELNPDVIFNTGDMFDSKAHFGSNDDVLAAFRTLNIPHYFVYGNHDEHVGAETVIEQMKKAHVTVLLNEVTYFDELQIVGLNNMLPDSNTFDPHTSSDAGTIEQTLHEANTEDGVPTIILHHRPDGVKYMQEKGANLLLAGHTHAGQIFPFTFIAKLMFGYNSGLYKYENMDIHVSEGIGTIFSPIRLGTRSEMTIIRLVPDTQKNTEP